MVDGESSCLLHSVEVQKINSNDNNPNEITLWELSLPFSEEEVSQGGIIVAVLEKKGYYLVTDFFGYHTGQ